MRQIVAAALAGLLVACSGVAPSPGPSCTSAYQCEIEAYGKAR